jgi:outer membrane protein OmpA-like peptidoglycan-associated protein
MSLSGTAKRLVLSAALLAGVLGLAPRWAAGQALPQECSELRARLDDAVQAGDLKRAAAGEREIGTDPICNSYLSVAAKEAVLDLYRKEDERAERAGASPGQRLAQLDAALRYSNGWNAWDIWVRIGDLKRLQPDANGKLDTAAISLAYDRALRAIDKAPTSARPSAAEIARIDRLAYQFEAVSAAPVPRSGNFTRAVRQVNVQRTPVPLQFVFDSDQFTEAGRAQAENLLRLLKEQSMPQLHLIGHTDPVGSDEYNDKLSVRRAVAVKSFLTAQGYPAGRITTEGRGKRDIDKLKIDDRTQFTEDQIHQMLRRVELVWKE